jgi:hypothetical protein
VVNSWNAQLKKLLSGGQDYDGTTQLILPGCAWITCKACESWNSIATVLWIEDPRTSPEVGFEEVWNIIHSSPPLFGAGKGAIWSLSDGSERT